MREISQNFSYSNLNHLDDYNKNDEFKVSKSSKVTFNFSICENNQPKLYELNSNENKLKFVFDHVILLLNGINIFKLTTKCKDD